MSKSLESRLEKVFPRPTPTWIIRTSEKRHVTRRCLRCGAEEKTGYDMDTTTFQERRRAFLNVHAACGEKP